MAEREPTGDTSCSQSESKGDGKEEGSGAKEEGGTPTIKKLFAVGPDGVPPPLPVERVEREGEETTQER